MNHMGTGQDDAGNHAGLWIGAGVLLLTVAAATRPAKNRGRYQRQFMALVD